MSKSKGVFDTSHEELTIDCGSSRTRIFEGKRLVFDEPTALAVQDETNSVLAVGKNAQGLIGRVPIGVSLIFPVEFGRVAHPEYLKIFLETVVGRLTPNFSLLKTFRSIKGTLALPTAITPVEQQLFQEVARQAGLGSLTLKPGIVGAFKSMVSSRHQSNSHCLVVVGAQTTQVGIFSAGQLSYEARWEWGGLRFTEIIKEIMRQEEQLAVSWQTAESVKLELSSLLPGKLARSKVAVRGKDILSQASRTAVVSAEIFLPVFKQYINELLENFELYLSELPTEMATACLEEGLHLVGGSSLVMGLENSLAEHLHTPVFLSRSPALAVVEGLAEVDQKGA